LVRMPIRNQSAGRRHFRSDGLVSLKNRLAMNTPTNEEKMKTLIMIFVGLIGLDGTLVVEDRAHGCTGAGIGEISIGVNYDENLSGSIFVDNIRAEASGITPVESIKWGNLKQIYR